MQTNIQTIMNAEKNHLLNLHLLYSFSLKCFNQMALYGSEALDFNAYECKERGHTLIRYNSCGNHH